MFARRRETRLEASSWVMIWTSREEKRCFILGARDEAPTPLSPREQVLLEGESKKKGKEMVVFRLRL